MTLPIGWVTQAVLPMGRQAAREVDMPTSVDEPDATGSFYLYPIRLLAGSFLSNRHAERVDVRRYWEDSAAANSFAGKSSLEIGYMTRGCIL
ncbi:MAG: hypothetical protein R2825_12560 [Saprospiraceae bacterium]